MLPGYEHSTLRWRSSFPRRLRPGSGRRRAIRSTTIDWVTKPSCTSWLSNASWLRAFNSPVAVIVPTAPTARVRAAKGNTIYIHRLGDEAIVHQLAVECFLATSIQLSGGGHRSHGAYGQGQGGEGQYD